MNDKIKQVTNLTFIGSNDNLCKGVSDDAFHRFKDHYFYSCSYITLKGQRTYKNMGCQTCGALFFSEKCKECLGGILTFSYTFF